MVVVAADVEEFEAMPSSWSKVSSNFTSDRSEGLSYSGQPDSSVNVVEHCVIGYTIPTIANDPT